MAQIRCDACQQSFNRQSSLTRHKTNFHSVHVQKTECNICIKKFSRRDLLLRHERLHRGEGLQPCSLCGRKFRGDYVERHESGCRLRSLKALTTTSTVRHSNSVGGGSASTNKTLQWQDPQVAPSTEKPPGDGNRIFERRVQQPHRYVLLRNLDFFANQDELFSQVIAAIESGSVALLKVATEAWQAKGLSTKQLDGRSVAANDGWTLIARAWKNLPYEGVDFILTLDLDFNLQDACGRTALHWLSEGGLTGLASKIIGKTADINARDFDLETPLCLASEQGHVTFMRLLCDHGADVNASMAYHRNTVKSDSLPCTPLEHAIYSGYEEGISLLIDAGADPNLKGRRLPLETAILCGRARDVEILRDAGADPYLIEAKYIYWLVEENDNTLTTDPVYDQPAQKYASLNIPGMNNQCNGKATSLSFELLDQANTLSTIASDNIQDLLFLFGDLRRTGMLLGELKNAIETWPLNAPDNIIMRAAKAGAVNCLRYMLLYCPDLDLTGSHGWSALHYACDSGSDQTVRLLLEHGARMESCSEKDETPLCIASRMGRSDIMTTLLDAGANVNGSASLGHTSPLHVACEANHKDAVTLLLSRKADVELGYGKISPLETALWRTSADIVAALLHAGASSTSIPRSEWIRELRGLATRGGSSISAPAEKANLLEAASTKEDMSERWFTSSILFDGF